MARCCVRHDGRAAHQREVQRSVLDAVNFEFATATRIIFGAGRVQEAGKLAKEFGSRALVVLGKSARAIQRAEPLLSALTESGIDYATFSVAGEPTVKAIARGRQEHCELVISFGGGSVIDTGKAI